MAEETQQLLDLATAVERRRCQGVVRDMLQERRNALTAYRTALAFVDPVSPEQVGQWRIEADVLEQVLANLSPPESCRDDHTGQPG